jgi:hypothetical protein
MADAAFSSPKRRIARAKQHVANINAQVLAFFDAEPYAKVVERNSKGLYEYKVKLTKSLPDEITDLAYEALEADDAAGFENVMRGRLKALPADILALLRSLQPYKGGNDLIWALNRIRRQGTHRLIVPAVTDVSVGNIRMTTSSPFPLDIPPPAWNSEKDEIVFAVSGPPGTFDYDVEFAFFIAFGQVEGVAGEPVGDALEDMIAEVERIVLAIKAESRRMGLFS